MIKMKYQPLGSNLCGQTCIAMICGISIGKAINSVGHKRATSGPQLHKALKLLKVNSSKCVVRLKKNLNLLSRYYEHLPKRCVAKLRAKGIKTSHWVLIWYGKTYDPVLQSSGMYEYISSYLEIQEM